MQSTVRLSLTVCVWFCFLAIANPCALSSDETESPSTIHRAIQRLASLSDQQESTQELLTHFEQLGKTWDSLNIQIEAAHEREREKLAKTLPPFSTSFRLNPWDGTDQSPPAYPQFHSPSRLANKNLPESSATFLLQSIPPLFRLAEFLGLGGNELCSEAFYSTPHIFFGDFNSHQIKCRVHQHIYGLFTPDDRTSPIETFRLTLQTQDFVDAIEMRISREVKPHHFSLRELPIGETFPGPQKIQWVKNNMATRIPYHSKRVGLPESKRPQHAASVAKLTRKVNEQLLSIRQKIAASIEQEVTQTSTFKQFQHSLNAIKTNAHSPNDSSGHRRDCPWQGEALNAFGLLRDQINLIGKQGSIPSRRLPKTVEIEMLHGLRHLAAPENTTQAVEISWSTRFTLVAEQTHE